MLIIKLTADISKHDEGPVITSYKRFHDE